MRTLYNTQGNGKNSRLKRTITVLCGVTFVAAILTSCLYSCLQTSGYKETIALSEVELVQLDPPAAGDPIAVVSTTLGDISFALYPDEAPQTVANFQQLADSGYYNNTCIYRVEAGAFFAAGSKTSAGTIADTGVSTEHIPRELSQNLWPLRGALCALDTSAEGGVLDRFFDSVEYFTGSRFLVANTVTLTAEEQAQMTSGDGKNKVADAFIAHGGLPNLSRQVTVFGQAYAGLDVLDAITAVQLTGEENAHRPAEDLFILSVTTGMYEP